MARVILLAFTSLSLSAALCFGQGVKVYTVDTVVGGTVYDGLPANATPLSYPSGLWLDRDGTVWVADTGNNVIWKFNPAGGGMRVAVGGGTTRENSRPVPGLALLIERPSHITGDASGNIYFTESGGHRVHKMTPDGQVVTIVGTGEPGFSGDGGPAQFAKLNRPSGIAIDAAANLYITDLVNCRIRRVDSTGIITTFAGNGDCTQQSADGSPATQTALGPFLSGLGFDAQGNLYVGTTSAMRKIDLGTRIVTTFAGRLERRCYFEMIQNRPATAVDLCSPNSIVFDPRGNAYFTYDNGVLKWAADTGLLTYLGGNGLGHVGIVRDSSGKLIVAAAVNGFLIRTDPSTPGPSTIIAGTSEVFDGPARGAVLAQPHSACLDAAGMLYIADHGHGRLRRYDPAAGRVATVVGGGATPLADGVAATAARIGMNFGGLFVDAQGNILFSGDTSVWKADAKTGTLSRIAGQVDKEGDFSGDGGPARNATLNHARNVVADASGNVYISDMGNNRVRRVDAATGIITTIAGNGTAGNSGDGGPATAASVGNPVGHELAFDREGRLLIGSGTARRVDLSTGIISTVQARNSPGGPLGPFTSVNQVGVDNEGNIYGYGAGAGTVWQVRASDSVRTMIAGASGVEGFFGDGGLAALARFSEVHAVVPDAFGNVYLVDTGNNRVRKLTATVLQPLLAVSPGTVFFTALQGSTLVSAQQITIASGNELAFNWTLAVATTTGGNWLNASTLSGSVSDTSGSRVILTVDSSRLGAGTYRGTVTITATGASNSPQTVEVVLTVTGAAGATIGLSQQYLNFQGVQGGANPPPQTLTISNAGSGTLSWSATAETSSGGQWLKVSSALGTAPSTLTVSCDITGLSQGVHQGQIVLRNLTASETKIISVVLTVSRTQPILLPTQTGFLFVGIEGSLVIGPQSFAIQNAGQGKMDWQVQVNLPASGDWLRVSPTSGTIEASQSVAPTVTLLVDPGKLRAGVHVGLLTLTASGALNSPQTAIVLVNMLARGSAPVGTINPLGLIFTSPTAATGTLTQGISMASTGGQPLQFLARAQTQAGGSWLSVSPEQGVLLSSSETVALNVQARPSGLSAGVYAGSVILNFGTGVTLEVAIALVVWPATTSQAAGPQVETLNLEPGTSSAACNARRLVLVETMLGNRFSLQAGWPIPMLVQAADDCGSTVTNATVTASFTGGEPPLVFQNLRNGYYSATWVPAAKGSIGVTIRAVAAGLEDGVFQFAGALGEASRLPLLYRDGWVNAASFDRYKPLAPGMIFSLFGSNLAEGKNLAGVIPLPKALGSLKATLGGYEVPLFYADGGQVNAQVPFELGPGAATLVVTGKDAAGAPGTVTIVNAQPGIFTISQSGTGQGVVLDAQNNVVDSNHPVKAGDVVVIYATGLGPANPAVATGASAPVSPLSVVTVPVKITIGGLDAAVEFAGMAPGFVGLYQVNARVPANVTAGNAVPLVLIQNGVPSNTVTLAVQ